MKEDLFTNLPTEIMIDILLRLRIRSIIMCKIVCKSWREVVGSIEFAKSHLSKAAPHLVFFLGEGSSIPYKMVEFVDEHCSPHRCKIVFDLSLPNPGVLLGSINGFLFKCSFDLFFWCNEDEGYPREILVYNPITRECMKLPPAPQFEISGSITAGVGVSKKGGQYKIVRILHVGNEYNSQIAQCKCQVHTVGSGSWRSFSAGTQFKCSSPSVGVFFNGNLHWLAYNSKLVSCFDLETECFTSFPCPLGVSGHLYKTLSVVGDRLCLCDSIPHAIVFWFMTEYGEEKSWTKELLIEVDRPDPHDQFYGWLFPIKVFMNGDILIANEYNEICCYSKTTNAIHNTGIHERDPSPSASHFFCMSAVIYTPTFLPLRTLLNVTENICSF